MDTALLLWLGGYLTAQLMFGVIMLMDAALAPPSPEPKPMSDTNATENPTPAAPTRAFPDFNGNGVPDYQEGWFWRTTWTIFSGLVRTFAKPYTLIYKGVEAAERMRAESQVPRIPSAP